MNRLMRAGYSSSAIFKLFKQWRVEVVEGGGDSDSYAEKDEYDLPEF